jgi:hypothetical protein
VAAMTKKFLILALSIFFILCLPRPSVQADAAFFQDDAPYATYTVDYQGELTRTLTAYRPIGSFSAPGNLDNPQDVTVRDGLIYVADAAKKRVVVFNQNGAIVRLIGVGTLENPTGLGISPDGLLYVADKAKNQVFQFDLTGTLLQTFGRPTEPLFGASNPFVPIKVAAGAGENIYVIGEGSTSGVIQLAYDGSFLGYFGVNLSNKSLIQRIAEVFVKEGEYAGTTPPSPTNIVVSNQSLVYTSTPATVTALKKLDVNGNNILTTVNYNVERSIVDLDVSAEGYVYAIYEDGLIVEYDPAGNLLFAFNAILPSQEVAGLVRVPSGIAVDEFGYLFVTDAQMDRVLLFEPTAFTTLVHQAIDRYNNGSYAESRAFFQTIVRQNANFALAHSALGKAYFHEGNYAMALEEFRLANDKAGYSEVFWELRDGWLKANLGNVFTWLIVFFALSFVLKQMDKRTLVFAKWHTAKKTFLQHPSVRKGTLLFLMMRHPIEASYQIKRERRGTVLSATVVLLVLYVEYLLLLGTTGYLFSSGIESIHLFRETAVFFGVIGLFVFANYLVATLADGEGWLKDVYVATAYAFAPAVVGIVPYLLLTNITTLNEQILVDLAGFVIVAYTAVLVFVAVKEIHNYEIGQTFKNLLMTVFTMLVIVLIGFILYVFGSQLTDFLGSLIKEVVHRVFA